MDHPTVIVKALAAGAAASLRPNVLGTIPYQTPIADAYNEMKESLAEQFPRLTVDLLDIGPASAARQEMLLEQLREAEQPIPDILLEQARGLLELCSKESPESLLAAGLKAQALTLLDWPTTSDGRSPSDNEVQGKPVNTGTNVHTADGEHVGEITGVVLDLEDKPQA